nr:RNA-directed DNA polymerase, eukaryota [Tanacetum cinerariifolium]
MRSNQDDVLNIYTSFFVTNFPEQTTSKELWRPCKQYGNVIDVFIPNRRSKLDASYKKVESRPSSSYIQAAKVGISSLSDAKALKPALVLDDSCAHEPNLALFLVGVSLCAWSHNTFTRIASIWGTLLYDEDENSPHFHRKRLCIKTSFQDIIFASQKIIVKEKVFLIRFKELTGWAPSFNDDSNYDDESVDSQEASILKDECYDKNSDIEEIPKTVFDKSEHVGNISPACNEVRMETRVEEKSKDPFNIYDMLNKKKPTKFVEHSNSDIQYPPGFTPYDRTQVNSNLDYINETKVLDKEPGAKASFQEDVNGKQWDTRWKDASRILKNCEQSRSSRVLQMNLMSLNIQGLAQKAKKDWVKELCYNNKVNFLTLQETKMEKVDLFNIKACWGNINCDYVVSPSVGNSGGILCVWDPNLFYKENSTVLDFFIAIMGNWLPNNKKLLVISVYAPQELAKKESLEIFKSLD